MATVWELDHVGDYASECCRNKEVSELIMERLNLEIDQTERSEFVQKVIKRGLQTMMLDQYAKPIIEKIIHESTNEEQE